MPITAEQIQGLKRTNISKDTGKTAQRTKDIWKGLKLVQRNAIKELAGVTAQTIYRVYNDGGISIKLTIAFAQTLGINPYYITGEVDESGEYTDELLRELLLKNGYQELAAEIELSQTKPAKRKYTRRAKPETDEVTTEDTEENTPVEAVAPQSQPVPQSLTDRDDLTADDLQNLVFALFVQAKAGIPNAKEKLDQIKSVIFS